MNVLVDTSVWSLALRRSHAQLSNQELDLKGDLQRLIEEGRVQIIGPIRQELLSGIRRRDQSLRIREQLSSFEDALLATEDYEEAARIHNTCRAAGIAGSSVDFLICAVALLRKWQVFTLDQDFQKYARHADFLLFVPQGSRS